MSQDANDWQRLNQTEQDFILCILGFFAASDGIVVENLVTNFCSEVQLPEARAMYSFQAAMENIHSETYSLMIDTLATDAQKGKLFRHIETHPGTKAKAEWAQHYMKAKKGCVTNFSERLIAFAAVEGIMFSSSFCALFWLKNKGKCPGLTFSNELISRDEGLHRDFAIELLKMCPRLPREIVLEIIKSAVDVELEFVKETLPTKLKNMNEESMAEYVKFVADHLLTALGYEKEYKTKNPFFFMENISIEGKTNFFEKRVAEYSKAGVGGDSIGTSFNLNVDF